mmetsp:Transcript_96172/g.277702  ORF Transcript_96172/g.277702 Transcript_96172/m.277702 type:complete len:202 (+) Transcript_96172:374-979(+)
MARACIAHVACPGWGVRTPGLQMHSGVGSGLCRYCRGSCLGIHELDLRRPHRSHGQSRSGLPEPLRLLEGDGRGCQRLQAQRLQRDYASAALRDGRRAPTGAVVLERRVSGAMHVLSRGPRDPGQTAARRRCPAALCTNLAARRRCSFASRARPVGEQGGEAHRCRRCRIRLRGGQGARALHRAGFRRHGLVGAVPWRAVP